MMRGCWFVQRTVKNLFVFLTFCGTLVHSQGLLDLFNLGLAGLQPQFQQPVQQQPAIPSFSSFTSQGLGLLNYLTNIQRNPVSPAKPRGNEANLLGIPGVKGFPEQTGLPNIPFLSGVPVVPGVAGSLPGAGACLPKGTPLVNPISPSLLQNLLRNVPGAQDVLRSFVKVPGLDPRRLMGKWHWVVVTPSVNARYCATSDFSGLTNVRNDGTSQATFVTLDSFREGSPTGPPKIGFGYGMKHKDLTSVYTQSDPCPYQVVNVGPISAQGQYEYIVLSNWAKYPVIGMVRSIDLYEKQFMNEMYQVMQREGYINFLTDAFGSVQFLDWRPCRVNQLTSGNIVGNLLNGLLFG